MTLRQATNADIPGMHRVRVAVRENALSDPARITPQEYVAALERLGRSWVVELDGAVVGFASGYFSGEIWALFVHPDCEARGFGAALHSVMVDWLWSQGLTRLSLSTGRGTRAEAFYLARGWRPCGSDTGPEAFMELSRPG